MTFLCQHFTITISPSKNFFEKSNFPTLLQMKILWAVWSGSSQSNLSSEICSRHAGFCARPAVTPGDLERLSQALLAASNTLQPHVYFDTDELKPPTSWLSSRDKKGREKVAKKRRHVLDMTELRQRPIAGNCMTDRAIRPQYLRHMPAAPDPWQPKISEFWKMCMPWA